MPVDAVLDIAVLSVHTGVQTRQVRDGLQLLLGSLVLVLEDAFVAFRARTAEVVVIAQLGVAGAALRALEDYGGDGECWVEAAVAGRPVVEFRVRCHDVKGRGRGVRGAVLDSHGEDHGWWCCKGDACDAGPGTWWRGALPAPVAYGLQGQLLELAKGGVALEELIVAEDMVKV